MPDDITPDTPPTDTPDPAPETPAPGTETPPPAAGTPDADDAAQDAKDEDEIAEATKVAELPDWAQTLVKNLRAENANHRTRATTAEQKLADAKTPEQVEAAVEEIKTENARLARELLVTRVASKHELPAELADLLKGDDEAALEAHAKTLAKYAGSSEPENLSGGLNPTGGDAFDPVKAARSARRSRY